LANNLIGFLSLQPGFSFVEQRSHPLVHSSFQSHFRCPFPEIVDNFIFSEGIEPGLHIFYFANTMAVFPEFEENVLNNIFCLLVRFGKTKGEQVKWSLVLSKNIGEDQSKGFLSGHSAVAFST